MKFRHTLQPGDEIRLRPNPSGGVILTATHQGEWIATERAESFAMLVTGPMAPAPPNPQEKVIYVDFERKERMR